MFTGIVEEIGTLKKIVWGTHSAALTIQADRILSDAAVGDSIAVNGICLTVTSLGNAAFTADVMHETLNRSSLKGAKPGMHVNLERAMAAGGRFGGHIVSGHVDGTGTIREIRTDDNAVWYTISAGPKLLRYRERLHHHRRYQPDGGSCSSGQLFCFHDPAYKCGDNAWRTESWRSGQSGNRYYRKICGEAYASGRTGDAAEYRSRHEA